MPYILEKDRASLVKDERSPDSAGELNFVITCLIEDYRDRFGTTYKILNEIMGVLECAKSEFYRRVVIPYEDDKIQANGDVYSTP